MYDELPSVTACPRWARMAFPILRDCSQRAWSREQLVVRENQGPQQNDLLYQPLLGWGGARLMPLGCVRPFSDLQQGTDLFHVPSWGRFVLRDQSRTGWTLSCPAQAALCS